MCYRYTIPQKLLNDINKLDGCPGNLLERDYANRRFRWCADLLARSGPWQARKEGRFARNGRLGAVAIFGLTASERSPSCVSAYGLRFLEPRRGEAAAVICACSNGSRQLPSRTSIGDGIGAAEIGAAVGKVFPRSQ